MSVAAPGDRHGGPAGVGTDRMAGFSDAVVDSIRDAPVVLAGDASARAVNHAFGAAVGVGEAQATGRPLAAVGPGPWHDDDVRAAIADVEAGDGELRDVEAEGEHQGAMRPDLILLDLNLPRRSGRGVLADVKGDPGLRAIPVVVLTTSSDEADVVASYDAYANASITKPIHVPEFMRVVAALLDFWFEPVRLPRREDGDGGAGPEPDGTPEA